MQDLTHFPLQLPEEFVNSWESSSYKWWSTAKLSKIFTTLFSNTQKSKTCDTMYVRVSITQRLSNVLHICLRQRIRSSSWHSCYLIPNRTRSKRRWVSCDRRYRRSLSDLETSWPTQNQRPSIEWCRCKRLFPGNIVVRLVISWYLKVMFESKRSNACRRKSSSRL